MLANVAADAFLSNKLGTQLVYLTPGLGGGVWVASAMVAWWRQVSSRIFISLLSIQLGILETL